MACLSPSPSGRRLSELLEEQQEPFSLDLHLLEKGCSPTLLDGYDTTAALCWPATTAGNDAALVLRRLASRKSAKAAAAAAAGKKKKKTAARGLLQLLLSKILRGRSKPAALQCSESFKMPAAVAPSPPSPDKVRPPPQEDGLERYSSSSDESDDDEKQQLSPVSVLEAHPFEFDASSPAVHAKLLSSPSKNAAMDVFRELLDAAYSPALLTQLLAKTDDLLLGSRDATTAADDEDYDDDAACFYGNSCRTSPRRSCREDEAAAAAYWDAHRSELARVSELVASEVPASRLDAAADVQPERRDVGAEVEAAVFESLVRELVQDLGTWRC